MKTKEEQIAELETRIEFGKKMVEAHQAASDVIVKFTDIMNPDKDAITALGYSLLLQFRITESIKRDQKLLDGLRQVK